MAYTQWASRWGVRGMAAALGLLLVACGGSDITIGVTPTVTPTATRTSTPTLTPTRTPTQGTAAAVTGLVVLHQDFAANARDGVGAPPPEWSQQTDNASFGRALARADWSVDGVAGQRGVTGADGTFAISGLPPGRYTLAVSKTLDGNLVPLTIPFVVGDDGGADVVVEVGLGLVRTTVTYTQDGAQVREIRGPYGNWSITRNGRVSELGDPTRVLTDSDGDGRFDGGPCVDQVWSCGPDGACGDPRSCQCVAACPFCENCSLPGVCAPKGSTLPYRCGDAGTCAQPGDRCVCVSSCPECDDCAQQVCIPSCAPVEITAITINGPAQVVIGRQVPLTATAQLSDGTVMDVTYLASWQSSDELVAGVDAWATVAARAVGSTNITATLGTLSSPPWALRVVDRPTLQHIFVQNQACFCGPVVPGGPTAGVALQPCILAPVARTDILPVPSCGQVVLIGATLQFTAVGEFGDGSYEDITSEVQWQVAPPEVGDAAQGLFTARQAGTAHLAASLGDVVSDATDLRVVTEPTLVSLSIYPANWGFIAVDGGPVPSGVASPCFDCSAAVTALRGDQLPFQATAHYDTGAWRDVTNQVTWRSSDATVASIDAAGLMTAVQGGDATIDAVLEEVTSNPVNVRVVNEATLQSIYSYQEGTDRVVAKGDQRFFHATGYYDIGIARDVTAAATWRASDESVARFDTPGVLTGRGAGSVQVWAELGGVQSPPLTLEVFETSELAYCDPANINRAVWSDDFNRVTLESDCAGYTAPGVATLRYTVTETQPHGGIFDPCLDLYVYDGKSRVRTIREEGCGDPFVPAAAPGRDDAALKYQLRAFWDLKDDDGTPVPDGTYTIYGRFYLYYDPVVSIDVTVQSSSGPIPTRMPTPTPTPRPIADVVIRLGTAIGVPGEQVSVQATLQAKGVNVAGVQNDIIFGTDLRIDQTPDDSPNCQVGPTINKGARFAFLPSGCRPGTDCNGIRALVVAVDNVAPIPDGAVLYTCAFTIPDDAQAGGYPLRCAGVVAGGPTGQRVEASCTDGAVRVGGSESTPTPTPAVQCTPPLCAPGEVPYCPGQCPGGCGSKCASPSMPNATPSPAPVEGACFIGASDCTGSYFPTAQHTCCSLFQFGALPEALSWCPADQLDRATGKCLTCASSPCTRPPEP